MAVYQRDDYAEKYRRGPGCAIGLAWVAATVLGSVVGSMIAGLEIAHPALTGLDGAFWATVIGLTIGTSVGTAQALVLLPYLKLKGFLQWLAATIAGRVLRSVLIVVLVNTLFGAGDVPLFLHPILLLLIGALAGVVTGYMQKVVLEHRVAYAQWWVFANAAVSALTTVLVWYVNPPQGYLPIVIINALLLGVVTGYVLMDLLRHPTSRAEWTLPWRTPPSPPEREPEAQPSPEVLLEQTRREQG
jgi:hypothetical protein